MPFGLGLLLADCHGQDLQLSAADLEKPAACYKGPEAPVSRAETEVPLICLLDHRCVAV